MATKTEALKYETLEVLKNKIRPLKVARLRNKKQIEKAIKIQDSLVEKYKDKASKWNSAEIIRHFRESR